MWRASYILCSRVSKVFQKKTLKNKEITQQLVLGSSSIYRHELLRRLQIPFEVLSPDIDETPLTNERPDATALRLATGKARAVAAVYPVAMVIGADQAAVLEGTQLGKPLNHANATTATALHKRKRGHVLYRPEPVQWSNQAHSGATCCFAGQIPQFH